MGIKQIISEGSYNSGIAFWQSARRWDNIISVLGNVCFLVGLLSHIQVAVVCTKKHLRYFKMLDNI